MVDNAEAGYGWLTFPEVLEAAGITWKVYQDVGTGLDSAGSYGNASDPLTGNYGDNPLLYFNQYRDAPTSSPLYQRAVTGTHVAVSGTLFDQFRADCAANTLPRCPMFVHRRRIRSIQTGQRITAPTMCHKSSTR